MRNKLIITITVLYILLFLPLSVSDPSTDKVTFMLDFNIEGIANDVAEVDGNSVGEYYPGDIDNHYVCLADSASTATFGIASTGKLNYINLTQPSNYTMVLSQNYTNNKFIIPITKQGCHVIRKKMARQESFLIPYTSFITRSSDVTYLVVNYTIDIVGDFSTTRDFMLTIEKNNSQLIMGVR